MAENSNTPTYTPPVEHQFVLSYELLSLLRWLVEHETPQIKRMIAKALKSGLKHELQHPNYANSTNQHAEQAQHNVLEFFALLETLLVETSNEQAVESVLAKNLMPAIKHIDGTVCDTYTLQQSIVRASAKLESNPQQNPQDALFKELLKRWKPSKKTSMS